MEWLPKNYSLENYVSCCLKLLQDWKWIYAEKNTDILKAGILDKPLHTEILSYISQLDTSELNVVPFGFTKEEWPVSLKNFVKSCHQLRLNIPKYDLATKIKYDRKMFQCMSPKKIEEVIHLSALTAELCHKKQIKHVIDFGSGLGYVDRILVNQYSLSVLGLEKDRDKVLKAKAFGGGVKYEEFCISEDTIHDLKQTVEDWLQGSPVCFIALHGCGDLSIHIVNLFGSVEEAKLLILIPCCYHRSEMRPLTPQMRESKLIGTTLLRLASEGTAERWRLTTREQHLAHARSVLARAVLQLFPSNGAVEIKKKRRHLLRSMAKEDWDKCFDRCIECFSGFDEKKLREIWKSNEWRLNTVESYSCLQVCLQAVAEGLVLTDIFLFIVSGIKASVELVQIFDVIVSPRSVAFLVSR